MYLCVCVFLCLTSDVGPWGKRPGVEVSEIRCADKLVLPWGATKQPITQTRTHTLSICCTFSLWSWPRGAPQLLFSLFRRPASRSFTSPSIFFSPQRSLHSLLFPSFSSSAVIPSLSLLFPFLISFIRRIVHRESRLEDGVSRQVSNEQIYQSLFLK